MLDRQDSLLTNAMGDWLLQKHGTRVETYNHSIDAMLEWCEDKVKKLWNWSKDDVLTSHEKLVQETTRACGKVDEDYHSFLRYQAMIRQTHHDMLRSKGQRIPVGYFWFEDAEEAMMFKLVWG